MREILFRGKRVDNGDWIESSSIRQWRSGAVGLLIDKVGMFKVNPDTVGQYTGSTDKNGKKIFEGDILEFVEESGAVCHDEVIWYDMMSGFKHVTKDGYPLTLFDEIADKCTVIGNIYDNPELIGGEMW